MLLQIEDINHEIVLENNIKLAQGDILVCKLTKTVNMKIFNNIAGYISKTLSDSNSKKLILPDFIDLKILKREA